MQVRAHFLAAAATVLLAAAAASAATYYSDPWITGRVKMELMLSSEINATDVEVDTVDRVVFVHGSVPTAEQRELVEKLAGRVTGVRAVRNLLRVVPTEQKEVLSIGDDALKRRVDWALSSDPWLSDSSLKAESVTEGMVVIGGRAASMSDHLRALTLVRGLQGVKGVASVAESPDLLTDEEILRSNVSPGGFAAGSDSDAQVTSRVKMALAAATEITAANINVDTRNGVVTLFGTVTDAGMRKRVVQTTLSVEGVQRINDDLQIASGGPLEKSVSDADLQSRISQFLKSAGNAFTGVRATVEDGAVHLEGRVPRQSARLAAVVRVRAVPGVRSVSEDLQVVGTDTKESDTRG